MPKTWFITGSSRGLGRALTTAVLDHGDHVVATARRPAQLDELVDRYGPGSGPVSSTSPIELPRGVPSRPPSRRSAGSTSW